MTMTPEKSDNAKIVLQTVTALLLTILTAINGWALTKIVEHDSTLAYTTARVEQFIGQGERYTRSDAESDLGHLVEKVNDHELRIRQLESTR